MSLHGKKRDAQLSQHFNWASFPVVCTKVLDMFFFFIFIYLFIFRYVLEDVFLDGLTPADCKHVKEHKQEQQKDHRMEHHLLTKSWEIRKQSFV